MHTQTFRRVTSTVKRLLPLGKETDPLEAMAKVPEFIASGTMGYVKFQGSWWRAYCPSCISLQPGTRVRVTDCHGLTLIVEPFDRDADRSDIDRSDADRCHTDPSHTASLDPNHN